MGSVPGRDEPAVRHRPPDGDARGQRAALVAARALGPVGDVIEREDEIVVTAELPGVADKDVEVTVDEGVLRISGARELTEEVDDERFHRIERSYGGFERTFPLPAGVDPDSIRAGIAYGVLKVTIPKPAAPTPRRIAVNPAGD